MPEELKKICEKMKMDYEEIIKKTAQALDDILKISLEERGIIL